MPKFHTENEEADWWASHTFTDEVRDAMITRPVPDHVMNWLRRFVPTVDVQIAAAHKRLHKREQAAG